MAHDIDYQTRVILNMDYSKTIAKARREAAAGGQGIQLPGAAAASAWNPKSAEMSATATGALGSAQATSYAAPINASPSYRASAAQTTAIAQGAGTAEVAAEKPSLFRRILSFFGVGD